METNQTVLSLPAGVLAWLVIASILTSLVWQWIKGALRSSGSASALTSGWGAMAVHAVSHLATTLPLIIPLVLDNQITMAELALIVSGSWATGQGVWAMRRQANGKRTG